MIKLTRLAYLSQQWKPHHELLLHWIAESASSSEVLLTARSHVQNLDLQTVIIEVDDGVQLLSLLPKIKYPIKGSAALWAYNFVENEEDELTSEIERNMLKEVHSNEAILECVERLLMKHNNFYTELTNIIYTLPENDLLHDVALLSSLWLSQRSNNIYQSCEILKIYASALSSCLDDIETAPKLIAEIVSLNTLFTSTPMLELEEKILYISRNYLSPKKIIHVIFRIHGAHCLHRQNDKLIESLHSGIEKYTCQLEFHKECLQFTILLLSMDRKPCNKLLMTAIDYLGECEPILLRLLCEMTANYYYLHYQSEHDDCYSDNASVDKSEVRVTTNRENNNVYDVDVLDKNMSINMMDILKSTIIKKIEATLHNLIVNAHSNKRQEFLFQLLCLSYLQPNEGKQLLEEWLKVATVPELSTHEIFCILKILSILEHYPTSIIRELQKRVNITEMTREWCLYLAYCLINIDSPLSTELVKKCIGETIHRHFEHRKKTTITNLDESEQTFQLVSNLNAEEEAFLLLKILSTMKSINKREYLQAYKQMLEKIQYNKFFVMQLINKVVRERIIAEPFTQLLLEAALQFVHDINTNETKILLHFLAINSNRDANILRSLLDRIKQLPFSLECVLEAMQTARKLNLYQELRKYELVYNLTANDSIRENELLRLLMLCEHEEKIWLLKNIKCAQHVLTSFNINTASVEELLTLLLLVKEDSVKRMKILKNIAMHEHESFKYLNTKDIVEILETLQTDEPAEIIFRVASKIIQASNANELMRLYRVICNLSKVHSIMFRVIGKALITNAVLLTPENALKWLILYAQKNIRDDSVVKSLLKRVLLKSVRLTNTQKEQLEQVVLFYGYDDIIKKGKNVCFRRKRNAFFAVKEYERGIEKPCLLTFKYK